MKNLSIATEMLRSPASQHSNINPHYRNSATMVKLERIVFATDFSQYADEAKQYACHFADAFRAELHVLHVIHDLAVEVPDFGMGLAFPGFLENLPKRQDELEQNAIAALARQLEPNWQKRNRVVLATRTGIPFLSIVRYAREHFIDLIVMGTHGRSGLGHVLMGSVAEKVVRKANCPVLTIRPRASVEEPAADPAPETQPQPAF